MKSDVYRFVASLLIGACLCLAFGSSALAQGGDAVEPTDEQARLNAKAVDAIVDENYERAAKLLEVSLELGELNVTWLNLGRAYQKLGRCEEAKNAYLSVVSAPAVKEPSPRLINGKADQYLGELEDGCEQATEEALADDGAPEIEDAPEQGEDSADPEVADGVAQAEPANETPEARRQPTESSDVLAWTLTATGVVVMGGGVGVHFWAESVRDEVRNAPRDANGTVTSMGRQEALDKQSQANQLDTISVATIAAGALVTGGGLYLLFSSDDVEAAPSASIDADGGVSVGLTGRF